jgi:protein dithiol oxidoreductase (disulfide-forming)
MNSEKCHARSSNSKWRRILPHILLVSMLVGVWTVVSASGPATSKVPVAGVDYHVLRTPIKTTSPGKIEVLEFFNYACGHCDDFSQTFEAWKTRQADDVAIRYESAPYGGFFDEMSRAFYAARALRVVPKTHLTIFREVHRTRSIKAGDKQSIISAYGRLGVDTMRFSKEYDSAQTDQQLHDAKAIMRAANVGGVPSLIVAGRYRIDAGEGIGFESMLAVADHLVLMERNRRRREER